MEIKTKYNIFDEVYIIYNNKIKQVIIKGIKIHIEKKPYLDKTSIKTTYILYNYNFSTEYSEDNIFKTKKELIKSL